MMFDILNYLIELLRMKRKPASLECLVGKTAIVTGGNTGKYSIFNSEQKIHYQCRLLKVRDHS